MLIERSGNVIEWHNYTNQMTELHPVIQFITTFRNTFVLLIWSTWDLFLYFGAYLQSEILGLDITCCEVTNVRKFQKCQIRHIS